MISTINTPSTVCKNCALFGADYSEQYNKWFNSNKAEKDNGDFEIPYHLKDSYPELPNLTRSAEAGCELCAFLKTVVEDEYRSKEIAPRKRFWKRQYIELKSVFRLDPACGFDPTKQLALSLQLKFIRGERLLGIPRTSFSFLEWMEIASTSQGPDSPGPPVLPLPSEDKLCARNINMIHKWLNECAINHTLCKNSQTINFLPTRLLCVKSKLVYLVETVQLSAMERQLAQYLALSHCWGPGNELQYQTTSQNIYARLRSIEFADLPQNIKDAISVTRALGLNYLWIDSICIIQDQPKDIETEMKVMLDVYANAHVTISATCASSVKEGFLHRPSDTGLRVVIPRQNISKLSGLDDNIIIFPERTRDRLCEIWEDQVGESPWNQRAWTLQESLVSPRIIHFAKERLFFECATLDCLEGADISRPPNPKLGNRPKYQMGRSANFLRRQEALALNGSNGSSATIRQLYQDYYTTIQTYTTRKLTFTEDRAAAASSIVDAITRITKTSARHGLLMDDIHRGLLWRPPQTFQVELKQSKALEQWPSWSWLSYPGEVEFKSSPLLSVLEEREIIRLALSGELAHNVKEEQPDNDGVQLCLDGFLIKASLEVYNLGICDGFQVFAMDEKIGYGQLDYGGEGAHPVSEAIFVFSLSKNMEKSERGGDYPLGLILVPHNNNSFKRIGIFQDEYYVQGMGFQGRTYPETVFKNLERQRVTLV